MKYLKTALMLLLATLLFTACDEEESYYDNIAPAAPTGVMVVSRDGEIEVSWEANGEGDLDGYNIYWSDSYNGQYEPIASTYNTYFIDTEAGNGELYYYAVTAFDCNNNESELSYDEVYGVARPEGRNQNLFDYIEQPDLAGYDFSDYAVIPFDDLETDMFFENYEGTYYLNVWEENQIQDMGATDNLLEIAEAPASGWVVKAHPDDNVKYVEAVAGHTYVIRVYDNHYAKVRITSILPDMMSFDWTYQTRQGETLLKGASEIVQRTDRSKGVVVHRDTMNK